MKSRSAMLGILAAVALAGVGPAIATRVEREPEPEPKSPGYGGTSTLPPAPPPEKLSRQVRRRMAMEAAKPMRKQPDPLQPGRRRR